ncbi:g9818 [Coccomyxa viridis]|uniref:G9818 protein n=1 Tax=Coccomyxa viridis TaxID=1274662 RepID=A0ABP1G6J4_9CHLO
MLERSEDAGEGSASCAVPPLLPSLLAACAPSAELKLYVAPGQGEKFLAVSLGYTPSSGGLKDLPKLEVFVFDTNCRSWDVKRPWEEILPIHSLQYVKLGSSKYLRWEHEGRVYFQQSWWEDPPDPEWV